MLWDLAQLQRLELTQAISKFSRIQTIMRGGLDLFLRHEFPLLRAPRILWPEDAGDTQI